MGEDELSLWGRVAWGAHVSTGSQLVLCDPALPSPVQAEISQIQLLFFPDGLSVVLTPLIGMANLPHC